MIDVTPADIDVAVRTLIGEARGEPYEGKKAVAHVILNRARLRNKPIAVICQQPSQFSCWNLDDPNRQYILDIEPDHLTYRACLDAFNDALDEDDFTLAATHYCTFAVDPYWAKGKTPCLVMGRHQFFNDIDGPAPKIHHTMQQGA